MYLFLKDGRVVFSFDYSADKTENRGIDTGSLEDVIVKKDEIEHMAKEICKRQTVE